MPSTRASSEAAHSGGASRKASSANSGRAQSKAKTAGTARKTSQPGQPQESPKPPKAPSLRLALQAADIDAALLPARSTLRRWTLRALQTDAELTLRFVGRREGRSLNRDHRGRDYATNVLTFEYGTGPDGVLRGDIVICLPVVVAEAKAQKKTLRQHLAHMVVHGTLHAQGHDHIEDDEAEAMEALERQILAGLRVPDPYAAA
jgi:probable rRNA maturation factor